MSKFIKVASKTVAEKSMADAAATLRGDNEIADVGVSLDGTWQRKGFSSTLGVVTAISVKTGKVLDVSILSKSCKGCKSMKSISKSDPNRYTRWELSHKCNLNYNGSSPGIETAGTVKIIVDLKKNMDFAIPHSMVMAIAKHILRYKKSMALANQSRSTNALVITKNALLAGFGG